MSLTIPNTFFDIPVKLDGKYLIHVSNPEFRNDIATHGLIPQVGDNFKMHWDGKLPHGKELPNLIFAKIVDSYVDEQYNFDWDDDIWLIDMNKVKNYKWFLDSGIINQSKYIVTYTPIPVNMLTLIYKGSGLNNY